MSKKWAEDFTGQIKGCWRVIERDLHPQSKSHETFWKCECINCGNIVSVRKTALKKEPKSCNNCKGQTIRQTFIDRGITKTPIHAGDRFGLLVVIASADKEYQGNKGYWKCKCDCGNIVHVRTDHLLGQGSRSRTISCGCAKISNGELKIKQLLEEYDIDFKYQYVIKKFSQYAPFDFAIFKNNQLYKLVEFDGEQHFRPIRYFGGEERFIVQQETDKRKNEYCKQNNIKLLRIPFTDIDNITIDLLLS